MAHRHRVRDREGTSGGGHSMSKDQSNDRNFVGGDRILSRLHAHCQA